MKKNSTTDFLGARELAVIVLLAGTITSDVFAREADHERATASESGNATSEVHFPALDTSLPGSKQHEQNRSSLGVPQSEQADFPKLDTSLPKSMRSPSQSDQH